MRVLCKKEISNAIVGTWYEINIEFMRHSNILNIEELNCYLIFRKEYEKHNDEIDITWKNYIFEDYFYTEKQVRTLKLKQLNESIL